MVVSLKQFSNALTEMAKRRAGKSIEIKDVQFLKIPSPIVVMLGGSISEVKDEQSWKAHSPMVVMVGGSVSEVKDEHP